MGRWEDGKMGRWEDGKMGIEYGVNVPSFFFVAFWAC
jgi:hypothetical protein